MEVESSVEHLPNLGDLSPMALADLMLLEVLARRHGTVLLEPAGEQHMLYFDGGGKTTRLALVDRSLAEATLARLAFIANLGLTPPQVGKIAVQVASHRGAADAQSAEVLGSLRAINNGLGVELHALSVPSLAGQTSAVAGIDGVTTPTGVSTKYQVLRELGRGGMGIVYLARHVALDKEVALKVLSPAMARRRALAAQFVVEARAACRARHPAIVDVTDFGCLPDGRNYLVMEYVPWPTLAHQLEKGPLAPAGALEIALEIARGLAAAHRHGVVHRDLKPANIFVNSQHRVKIGDFGLAQTSELTSMPLQGMILGTVPYMAPEQFDGNQVDRRADLYSFGCILYELLTGETPYTADDTGKVLEQHRSAQIPALHVDGRSLPEGLGKLHTKLLAKVPAERPDSFEPIIDELERCLEGLT